MKAQTITLLLALVVLSGCAPTPELAEPRAEPPSDRAPSGAPTSPATPSSATITAYEDVSWEDLNPARGDQSPRAGTLWGNRKADVATGYLLRPVDGFRSPPHIHNVTYRAVVIRG
ncbi:MAG: DUF4437 domain-containing protein, partial [Myxococcota bacterium]